MLNLPYRFGAVAAAFALTACLCAVPMMAGPALAQRIIPAAPAPVAPLISYADTADLVLKSPIIIDATIRSAAKVKPADAVGLAPQTARLLVTADVNALVRGPGILPKQIIYLVDISTDAKGRVPKVKKARFLLFARPVGGQSNQVQLTGTASQQPWSATLDAQTRRVIAETIAADAPPAVTGIGNAFHVPGSLPGEGETQIFLTTADQRPVSINVLRRPGEEPRWAVALSEIVDEAAAPPPRDTLLWYRLACFLPRQLPDRSLVANDNDNARAARDDYLFVLRALGPCTRTVPAAAS